MTRFQSIVDQDKQPQIDQNGIKSIVISSIFSDDSYIQYSTGYELCELKRAIDNQVHLEPRNKNELIRIIQTVNAMWKNKL